jgi:hypothetical protein
MNREKLEFDKKMGERTPTKIVNLTGKLVAYWVKNICQFRQSIESHPIGKVIPDFKNRFPMIRFKYI